jgi:hypothetical protein
MWKTLAVLALALGLGACSSSGEVTKGGPGNLAAVQCGWPTALNDAGPAGCRASRTFVQCHDPAGGGCDCASDGALGCDCGASVSAGPWTCDYACAADEYAVSCGSIGPSAGPPADAPSGCRSLGANPGGIATYCCPCD